MLKYKKKRIARIFLAVFIPILLAAILFALLHYYQKVDFEDINPISKTKELFYPSDKVSSTNAKMTESIPQKTASTPDTNIVSNPTDSLSNMDLEMKEIKLVSENIYATDTLNIQKDIMIGNKTYLIPINSKEKRLDSLLMNHNSSDKSYTFTLEFWLSPIGFNGYKRSMNKAVIFGITDIENVELQIVDQEFYLILNNAVFLLSPSNNFLKLTQQNSKQTK